MLRQSVFARDRSIGLKDRRERIGSFPRHDSRVHVQ
jgi:hypothetical protein